MEAGYTMRRVTLKEVRDLCERFHGYGSVGASATYAFGVFEADRCVAAYSWQPPPPGAARSACPEAPEGVLSLSRMVAVPRDDRALNHVSKPLRRQMRREIDRTRWPVLITFSDEGQGHTGYVYKCSGWEKTCKAQRPFYVDSMGRRASSYSDGHHGGRELTRGGTTIVQRWEHRICPRGEARNWMVRHGWARVPVPGKVWRSGKQAFTYQRTQAEGIA